MTTPEEAVREARDAVDRVRAFLAMKEPHPFQEEFSDIHTLATADLHALLALVDSFTAERSRLAALVEGMVGMECGDGGPHRVPDGDYVDRAAVLALLREGA